MQRTSCVLVKAQFLVSNKRPPRVWQRMGWMLSRVDCAVLDSFIHLIILSASMKVVDNAAQDTFSSVACAQCSLSDVRTAVHQSLMWSLQCMNQFVVEAQVRDGLIELVSEILFNITWQLLGGMCWPSLGPLMYLRAQRCMFQITLAAFHLNTTIEPCAALGTFLWTTQNAWSRKHCFEWQFVSAVKHLWRC